MKGFNFWQTILSQFQNSKVLTYIIETFCKKIKIGKLELVSKIINVDTAEGVQLDIIGALVGANRNTQMPLEENDDFGFDDNSWYGFDNPDGGTMDLQQNTGSVILNDTAFRLLIKMTAHKNISNCSYESINFLLKTLFASRGNAWATLSNVLEITFNFDFQLYPYERGLIMSGYLPSPAGYSIVINDASTQNTAMQ